MPTYEYRRPDGTTFEAFQKMSAPALTEDPETGVPVKRVISGGAGLQFKGDGFYLTDYTDRGKAPKSESAESKKNSDSSSKPEKKKTSESKPAPATSTSSSADD